MLKFENSDNTNSTSQTQAAGGGGWTELTYDFSNATSNVFTRLVIFVDFGGTTPSQSWYIDDVEQEIIIPDAVPPTVPMNLTASNINGNGFDLTWDASYDSTGINQYTIFQDRNAIAFTTDTSLTLASLMPNTTYEYYIIATDNSGLSSTASDTLSMTTTSLISTQSYINSITEEHTSIPLYEKYEITISNSATYIDPYDADDIQVDLLMTTPSGMVFYLPCFYFNGTSGSSIWKARFAPREEGIHSYQVVIQNTIGLDVSLEKNFEATTPNSDGFLHINPNSNYTLLFESGKRFRGVGENMAWEARPDINDDPKFTYDYMFDDLRKDSVNFIRTWMCPWNLPLEWKTTIFGRYTDATTTYNPSAISRMDFMIEEAEQNDIYFMLALDFHGALYTQPDIWGGNNHWKDHNGPQYFSANP